MRVTIVSQFFNPEPAITANALAEDLSAAGHDVTVITGFPNRPGGKLFPGYRQAWGVRQDYHGTTVRRVPMVINHDRNPVSRIANFVTFALSSLYETRAGMSADAVYVYATPMTAAIAPRIWKAIFRTPYILHVQDLWPESVTGSGMLGTGLLNRTAKAVLRPLLSWLYNGADSVIAIAPGMARMLQSRGVPSEKLNVMLNWADEQNVTQVKRSPSGPGLRLVYAGNLGRFQDLGTVIEAVRILRDLPDFKVEIVGDGTEEDRLQRQAAGLENVEFRGRLSRAEMPEVYRRSDFQLVTLQDLPLFRGTVPSKFQGSVAAGVPVITTVTGDVATFVEEYSLGYTARPEDPEALAQAIRKAYETPIENRRQLEENARQFYEREMSRRQGVQKITSLLQAAAERSGIPAGPAVESVKER